jgi:hypothetical protein
VHPVTARTIQTKLAINRPGDRYEQEADRVADQVMRMSIPAAAIPIKASTKAGVQRACACGGSCDACKGDAHDSRHEHLQMKPAASHSGQATAPPIVNDVLSSPGHPLDRATRAFMEPRFGHDFGRVRIHADNQAHASAEAMGARAYTVGHHIVFSKGESQFGSAAPRQLMAHELTHVLQQQSVSASPAVMRAPKKTPKPPPPPPTPCNFNCTAPAFLKLSAQDREAEFDRQCQQGYPKDTTFFSQPIPGATSTKLRNKLLAAASRAKRIMCVNGKDPSAYTLDRRVSTYSTHSPKEDRAVDIDYEGQTYVLHEKYSQKAAVESQLSPVYNRIAFWSLAAKSIIPRAIQTVETAKGGADARTWVNPDTGKKEAITTGELYDKLNAESMAMTKYFGLLLANDTDLQTQVQKFVDLHKTDPDAAKKLDLPTASTLADAQKFRQRIADDYRLVGGSKAQLKSFAGQIIADASHAPKNVKVDGKEVELTRPFRGGAVAGATTKGGAPDRAANRRPELGFVTLPREVVVALTQEGLVWGAIDFGGESGDVMHFDCRRDISGC